MSFNHFLYPVYFCIYNTVNDGKQLVKIITLRSLIGFLPPPANQFFKIFPPGTFLFHPLPHPPPIKFSVFFHPGHSLV